MYSGEGAYVLRLDSFTWRILRGPLKLPFEPVHGLDINRGSGRDIGRRD